MEIDLSKLSEIGLIALQKAGRLSYNDFVFEIARRMDAGDNVHPYHRACVEQARAQAVRDIAPGEKPVCDKCEAQPAFECDQCLRHFCSDHGTPGGDRQVQDVGAVAYPSLCWLCGGFDADA